MPDSLRIPALSPFGFRDFESDYRRLMALDGPAGPDVHTPALGPNGRVIDPTTGQEFPTPPGTPAAAPAAPAAPAGPASALVTAAGGIVPVRSTTLTALNGQPCGIHSVRVGGTSIAETYNPLLQQLLQGCRETGLGVIITDAHRAQNASYGAKGSRHKSAHALDLGAVGPWAAIKPSRYQHPTDPDNPYALTLARWFIAHGYTPGSERGQPRALLFGNGDWNRTGINHNNHIHISMR